MNRPKISVCMITYNHENYILDALNGILMQKTSFLFEAVICNDNSTDSTHKIITETAIDSEKIKFRYYNNEENKGMMGNFIFALQKCDGKYIALCEGDDYWTDPLKLQKQVDYLEANPEYAGSFHNTNKLDEAKLDSVLEPWRSYEKEVFTFADTITKTSLFHTSSFVFKTSLLLLPEWFKNVQSGDMALFSIIALKGPLYRVEDTMSVYRKNEAGVTSTISWRNYHKNRITLFQHLKSYCGPLAGKEIDEITNYHKLELKQIKKRLIKKKINGFINRFSFK